MTVWHEGAPADATSRQIWLEEKRRRLEYLRNRRTNDTREIGVLEVQVGNVLCSCGRAHAGACGCAS